AFGIVAHCRLADRSIPATAGTLLAVLFLYATLVRANAIFATAPLLAFLVPRPSSLIARGAMALAAVAAVLLASPFLDHRLFGAEPSGVEKTQPIFDLAAIAVATPGSPSLFTAAERAEIAHRHCVKSYFWDPLGDPSACG